LDIAEALLLGLDCSVIAGTGSGKTLPFVLPLLVETKKVTIIISPLNALEEDQVSRFQKMGIPAVAVNGETYSQTLHKEIMDLKYRVIITSPEMCIEHDRFRQLLSSRKLAECICSFVVDEAHCISQWGDKFRPAYSQLGTLRAYVPSDVPFLVTSATLPPSVLSDVHRTMHMTLKTTYHVNRGTDRPNITWLAQEMKAGKSDLEALSFLVPDSSNGDLPELTKTMVFFDDINLALQALKWLRKQLPPHLQQQVAVFNSRRSPRSKKLILEAFRNGEIKILLTTEAAGMGCDIPDIVRVVQFMVPKNMSVWMQRAGRAGRNPSISAHAVLLVQPSVFQEVKSSGRSKKHLPAHSEELAESVNYKKTIEEGLRDWINATGCRRDVADKYFGDGQPRQAPRSFCCDKCSPENNLLVHPPKISSSTRHASPSSDTEDTPSQEPDQNGKRVMVEVANVPNRRDEALSGARSLLSNWRYETWMSLYCERPWGIQALLPDAVLASLAQKARIRSTEDLLSTGWSVSHVRRHGAEVISMLADFDSNFRAQKDAAIKARADQRKVETAARTRAKKENTIQDRLRRKELSSTQPKPARPSRAKKVASAVSNENVPPVCLPIPTTPTHSIVHPYPYHTPIPFDYAPTHSTASNQYSSPSFPPPPSYPFYIQPINLYPPTNSLPRTAAPPSFDPFFYYHYPPPN
ncbi:P-loop containing nucleoside triphosphate hydrolase protein, partial [Agrocybe pediades]